MSAAITSRLSRNTLLIGAIGIIHTVGLLGMLSPCREWFLVLTPINLLVSAVLVGVGERHWNRNLALVLLGCFVVGFGAEVAGVATGRVFGVYTYGETLGLKLFEVPLVIGLNWAVLVYCTGIITYRIPGADPLKAAVAAALMTGLDYVMEPVAIALDFWSWESEAIPWQNYFAWFVISYVLVRVFHRLEHKAINPVTVGLFVAQAAFFGLLWAFL